jgi:hypothetical protein
VSALNEPHNKHFTTEKENRKPNRGKIKIAVPSEWKRNKTKLLRKAEQKNRTLKTSTDVPERKIAPTCEDTSRRIFFLIFPSGKYFIFSKDIGLWETSEDK